MIMEHFSGIWFYKIVLRKHENAAALRPEKIGPISKFRNKLHLKYILVSKK